MTGDNPFDPDQEDGGGEKDMIHFMVGDEAVFRSKDAGCDLCSEEPKGCLVPLHEHVNPVYAEGVLLCEDHWHDADSDAASDDFERRTFKEDGV